MAQTHIVVQNDTLWDLSEHYYGTPLLHPVLRAANNNVEPTTLQIGSTLTIPDLGSQRVHEVVAGDELGALAIRYYGDFQRWTTIAQVNGVADPRALQIGQLLWIPDGAPSDAGTPPPASTTPTNQPVTEPPREQPPADGDTVLERSGRHLLKATHVPISVPDVPIADGQEPVNTGGLVKIAAIRQFQLAPGDIATVRAQGADTQRIPRGPVSNATFSVLEAFEQSLAPGLQPDISEVAALPARELKAFASALIERRKEQLAGIGQTTLAETAVPAELVGRTTSALNTAMVAAMALQHSVEPPVGMLNLERIEMVPAGIQRGELVSTIPLAPGEETAVVHREWSVTSNEFTSIVTDELEEVSETGVTDNTDLSQSTSSQTQHSNQFNITGTVQGGIPIISGSTTTGFTAQDSESASATESRKHARTLTQKASSRSRREHKITISTKTETGTSETSTRILRNPSSQPIRIDYFSMMRQWRVRLYRYGLRLTYDVVVPEPAGAMRQVYSELESLRSKQAPFDFPASFADLDPKLLVDETGARADVGRPKYQWLADQYDAAVRTHPAEPEPITVGKTQAGGLSWTYLSIEFEVPQTAEIKEILVTTNIGRHDDDEGDIVFEVLGSKLWKTTDQPSLALHDEPTVGFDGQPFMVGQTGRQEVMMFLHRVSSPFVRLKILTSNRTQTIDQWKSEVWTTLINAAQTKHYADQQSIAARIATIEDQLAGVDTLTLRREENDEVMKSVIRWVLGPDFDLMPKPVVDAFSKAGVDITHGSGADGSSLGIGQDEWALVRRHENIVRFINQAIEWENVVTFLYSYFWDVPPSWRFIRQLRHADPNRQAFLRAGAARVVLTVRKGWEERWMRFAETGTIDGALDSPYLTIAREIAAYDDRNYPGIPPANPAKTATRLHDSTYTTSSTVAPASAGPVILDVADSAGFVSGLPVVLDSHDERGAQESVRILDIPGPRQITVEKVDKPHDGSVTPFVVFQPGEQGALIAEWNEYTPTSGTDIAVTSNLSTIA